MFTPDFITSLKPNEIFVFGSNLAGCHGGGAARIAHQKFGAVWGQGTGHHGQTYAIPTMHGGIDAIVPYVEDFCRYVAAHPELHFLVTRVGCGIAGFSDRQMAPLFAPLLNAPNVSLPRPWHLLLTQN